MARLTLPAKQSLLLVGFTGPNAKWVWWVGGYGQSGMVGLSHSRLNRVEVNKCTDLQDLEGRLF